MKDCVKRFFEFYVKGALLKAVEQIIPSPDISYSKLKSSDDLLKPLVNFIEASVFGSLTEACNQNASLCDSITKMNQKLEIYQEAIDLLTLERKFLLLLLDEKQAFLEEEIPHFFQMLQYVEKDEIPIGVLEIEHILSHTPEKFQALVKFHLMMTWGWQKLNNSKPLFFTNMLQKKLERQPWYPLQYSLAIPSLDTGSTDKIPIIFFEPIKEDLSKFLQELTGRPAIYAFTNVSSFFQMLQFPLFAVSLEESQHLIYILEFYPNQQLATQDFDFIKGKELYPLVFASSKLMDAYTPPLLQALKECMSLSKEQLKLNTQEGNLVYEISKRLSLSMQQNRLR